MKKVIVAGGAGFVGRQTLEPLLKAGFEVHVADVRSLSDDYTGIHWHNVDLFDFAKLKSLFENIRPTHLLNFAWFTRHGEYWSSPENFRSVSGNFKILELFAEAGGKRVVMAGTCAEYDWRNGLCVEDQTELRPATVYGSCKLAMYELFKSFAQVNDLSWAWGRIFFIFGPAENPCRFVPAIIRPLLKNQVAPCSHGNQVRDFMSTQDVGSAFAALTASELQGAINVASGQPISLWQIATIIEKIAQKPEMINFGAVASAPDEAPTIVASVERLRNELGWAPTKDIEQRLAETVDWWRRHD